MLRKESKHPSGVLRAAMSLLVCASASAGFLLQGAQAQTAPAQAQAVPTTDTTTIDPDGTAHITRVLPVPRTISPQAQERVATGATWAPGPNSPETAKLIAKAHELYPATDEAKTIAGCRSGCSCRPACRPPSVTGFSSTSTAEASTWMRHRSSKAFPLRTLPGPR